MMHHAKIVLMLVLAALGAAEVKAASNEAVKRNNFGGDLVKQGRLEEAVAEFQRAVEVDPRYVPAQANLAYTLDRLGRLEEALAAYRKTLELDPKNATVMNNLAVLHTKKGNHDEAILVLEQGLAVDPENASLRKNLEVARANKAVLQEREDRIEEARRRALAQATDPEAAYHLARTLAFHFKNDEALEWLAKALQLGYHSPAAWKTDPALTGLRTDPRFLRLVGEQ